MNDETKIEEPSIPYLRLPEMLEEGDLPRPGVPGTGLLGMLERHLGPLPQGGPLGTFKEREVRAVARALIELLGGKPHNGRWQVRLGIPGAELVALEPGEATRGLESFFSRFQADIGDRLGNVEERLSGYRDVLAKQEQQIAALTKRIDTPELPTVVREAVDYLNERVEALASSAVSKASVDEVIARMSASAAPKASVDDVVARLTALEAQVAALRQAPPEVVDPRRGGGRPVRGG